MQIYHAFDRLDTDRQDHKEREEYTETPRFHGISTNDIRFMEADRAIQNTISLMWFVFLSAAMYSCVSVSLVIGMNIYHIWSIFDDILSYVKFYSYF